MDLLQTQRNCAAQRHCMYIYATNADHQIFIFFGFWLNLCFCGAVPLPNIDSQEILYVCRKDTLVFDHGDGDPHNYPEYYCLFTFTTPSSSSAGLEILASRSSALLEAKRIGGACIRRWAVNHVRSHVRSQSHGKPTRSSRARARSVRLCWRAGGVAKKRKSKRTSLQSRANTMSTAPTAGQDVDKTIAC